MNTILHNLPQLVAAQHDVWIFGIISALFAIIIAFLVAKAIPWESDSQNDRTKRRIWFLIIGPIITIAYWVFRDLTIDHANSLQPLITRYKGTNTLTLVAGLVIYFGMSILIMVFNKKSKFASILFKIKS